MKATVKLYLDQRRKLKDESYPVKLRVYYLDSDRVYKTGYSLTVEEYNKVHSDRPGKLKDTKFELFDLLRKAESIIDKLSPFSFERFKDEFFEKKTNSSSLVELWNEIIQDLKDQNRLGNAESHQCAINSFSSFKKPTWERVTKSYLESYERWMIGKEKSITTVGIYCRALRTVFNEGIPRGLAPAEAYPFGKRKYQIPRGKGVKKALSKQEIKLIFNYQGEAHLNKYRDYYISSYLANGANLKDIAEWKFKDIQDGKIIFNRIKTERSTKTDPHPITVILTQPLKDIINRIGNRPAPDNYIFPIYKKGMTPEEKRKAIKALIWSLNKYIRKICKELKIEKHITFYSARHSFATILKQSGAPTKFIQDALGHSNESTTENYLASFEDDVLRGFAESLTDF